MTNQTKRIAEFLDGIIDPSLPLEEQIMLFSQEGSGVDGAINNSCTNQSVSCKGSDNKECRNFDSYCGETINRTKCEAMNGLMCEELNSSTALCGGQV